LPGLTAPTSESYKFSIEGMSCGSCVASVQGAVGQVGHAAAAAVRPV
jgi:copper chaperone CopZ